MRRTSKLDTSGIEVTDTHDRKYNTKSRAAVVKRENIIPFKTFAGLEAIEEEKKVFDMMSDLGMTSGWGWLPNNYRMTDEILDEHGQRCTNFHILSTCSHLADDEIYPGTVGAENRTFHIRRHRWSAARKLLADEHYDHHVYETWCRQALNPLAPSFDNAYGHHRIALGYPLP